MPSSVLAATRLQNTEYRAGKPANPGYIQQIESATAIDRGIHIAMQRLITFVVVSDSMVLAVSCPGSGSLFIACCVNCGLGLRLGQDAIGHAILLPGRAAGSGSQRAQAVRRWGTSSSRMMDQTYWLREAEAQEPGAQQPAGALALPERTA
jgi:hypothetical protein